MSTKDTGLLAGPEIDQREQELIQAIRGELKNLDNQDTASVKNVVAIGRHLLPLRKGAKHGCWEPHLKTIDMSSRSASRYMAIAKGSVGQIGQAMADVAPLLPYDVNRLERLTKLPLDVLLRLAKEMDLRKGNWAEVIKRVKEELKEPVAAPPDHTEKRLTKAFARVRAIAEGALQGDKPLDRTRLDELIAEGIRGIHEVVLAGQAG